MLRDTVSVTLSGEVGVYQPFHPRHKTLVARLISEGMLKRVFRTSYLYVEVFDPVPDGSLKIIHSFTVQKIIGRPVWAIWRRLPNRIRNRIPPATWISALLADCLIRSWIPRTQIFHGVMNNCLGQLKRAQQLGAVTLVDVGARHPKLWRQEIVEERRRFGVDDHAGIASGVTIRRMEREFEICDKITVLSSPARDSFREFAYGHKAEVVLPGIDHNFFTPPAEAAPSPVFRVCYAGRVELAKGLGYLLQAWKRLALSNAELVLIGKVQPDASAMLKESAAANIKLVGFIPPEELVQRYRNSNLLVFPSVTEGFGLVLLEAMACGVPVVGSDRSGAMDCVSEGKDGFIVPARDVDRLADVILWCYQHRDDLQLMGRAARSKIESQFTLDHYYERMIALYRAVAAK
jgi:alpha-maltose-1-phosphate synthase